MIFEVFQIQVRSDIATGSYLVGPRTGNLVAWVDPAEFSDEIVATIQERQLRVKCLLLTHGHFDHTGGIQRALSEFKCPLFVHENEVSGIRGNIRLIKDGDRIPLGSLMIEVYETPGHTPGSVTYRIGPYLFSGDALFAGSVGGTADPKAFQEQRNSLVEKVFPLGDELIVCPGHGPMSEVGVERRYNPFLN